MVSEILVGYFYFKGLTLSLSHLLSACSAKEGQMLFACNIKEASVTDFRHTYFRSLYCCTQVFQRVSSKQENLENQKLSRNSKHLENSRNCQAYHKEVGQIRENDK